MVNGVCFGATGQVTASNRLLDRPLGLKWAKAIHKLKPEFEKLEDVVVQFDAKKKDSYDGPFLAYFADVTVKEGDKQHQLRLPGGYENDYHTFVKWALKEATQFKEKMAELAKLKGELGAK